MIDSKIIERLLDLDTRHMFYEEILNILKNYSTMRNFNYVEIETSEGRIPVIMIAKYLNPDDINYVKIFLGAQHNEYNGLFGILEFLTMVESETIPLNDILREDQLLIFAPLMNPYGFINPRTDNKSGYYLKNGLNLNRYWGEVFAPGQLSERGNLNRNLIPEHAISFRKLIEKYWIDENVQIYILDFHETSLLERYLNELVNDLQVKSITYKFSHWLKEGIISNVIKLNGIPFSREPLFYKSSPNADHTHINLTMKQLEEVTEMLQEFISANNGKLAFYFCYNNKSKDFCERLANIVYNNLREMLWETCAPSYIHNITKHGCIVNLSDLDIRQGVYSMELESEKLFFNIFNEIERAKIEKDYINRKSQKFNQSIQLVINSIKTMTELF
jgi:hypothetical protein